MLFSYLKTAWRMLSMNKVFTFINVTGLAIGISAALVIYLIVEYEFSFENFQKDKTRIYRVVSDMHFPDKEFKVSGVPVPLISAVEKEVTGIEQAAAFMIYGATVRVPVSSSSEPVYKNQPSLVFADENYFKVFSYDWIEGKPSSLNEPFNVVLAESRARLYFGSPQNAMGRTLVYNDSVKAVVKGVVKNISKSTDFTFLEFISRSTIPSTGLRNNFGWDNWKSLNGSSQFFVKLLPSTQPSSIVKQMASLRKLYVSNEETQTEHLLQPLKDLHFNAEYSAFRQRQAHKPTLYALILIAIFLLLLASINFVNLTTAQATQRAREIGIRKTLGGSRLQLIIQFFHETFLVTLFSTILSVLITPKFLQLFADFIPAGVEFNLFRRPEILAFLGVLIVTITLVAGFYPSLVLSGYRPVAIIKDNILLSGGSRSMRVRKALSVFQFGIAQFFIIVTLVVGRQIYFSLNKDIGFRKDAVINISVPFQKAALKEKKQLLLERLTKIKGIEAVALGGSPPAMQGESFSNIKLQGSGRELKSTMEIKNGDSSYFRVYKLKLLTGRIPLMTDSLENEIAVNETFVKLAGYKDPHDIVGEFIERNNKRLVIVGVISDFNYKSVHNPIESLGFIAMRGNTNTFHIALKSERTGQSDWPSVIGNIEKAYKDLYPGDDFQYYFLDERIASFYDSEKNTARLLHWATGLCIVISCMGLLGLVIYTTNRRAKEIGVRKVLGASVGQLVQLLSKEYIYLVLISFVIVAPLAWWVAHNWLEDFSYRTTISWWIFGLSVSLMIVVAFVTLCARTISAALSNPVKALRT